MATASKLVLAVLILSASTSFAPAAGVDDGGVYPEFADPAPEAPIARLRLVLDPASMQNEGAVGAGETFDVFVVAHDVQIALRAWEGRLVVDPRLVLVEREVESAVDLGQGLEVRAALKPRDCLSGTPIVLARFRFLLAQPDQNDLVLGLGPADPASVPSEPGQVEGPAPVYLTCRPGSDLRPFDACEVCIVVNPAAVRAERDDVDPALDRILAPVRERRP